MRRFMTFTASLMLALAMLIAPDMRAQSRRSGGGSTTTQQSGSTSSGSSSGSRRSSGSSVSSSSSSTRSSSSSSVSRSSSRSSSGSATRSSGTVQQDNNRRRNSSGSSTTSSGSAATRSSGNVARSSSSSSSSGSATRSSGTVQQDNNRRRNSSGSSTTSSGSATTRSSGNVARSSGSSTRSSSSGTTVRSINDKGGNQSGDGNVRTSNVTRNGLTGTAVNDPVHNTGQDTYRDRGNNYRYNDGVRVDDNHNMYRIPPRERTPMAWDRPGHFWGDTPHYYGYRIHSLPPSWRRISHWGIDYYYHDGIYYRPFGGSYVICRPPFGTPLERAIDRAILRAIRFSYYYDTYRTYESAFDYYNVIARQNLIIAQQNARIIARNSDYALNSNRALTAYELANKLGLVQSYAYANAEYFYQDGVFYTVSASGVYTTIVPPAGALVTSLPDDYEVIVMGGIEYYLVDNTVYRTTVFEGEPYLEVLGQMYGSLYNQYNIYR